ncbi:hypothetical protein GCM10010112_65430 [Actinoplanes lobatus]|uniref:Tetratricopeptide (TPR) repeat protein n=1 Tax=Actinoplanes lobatus TaxID=113568 RepID=A0A7W7MJ33_9ACTN|nr:CHAT domain-containing protein [Actinoplanes lobatus]MBB4751981.1 tetratricopeptide (TPR) repeat protein [Actinoplanes lobatus]GGN85222.1 hypothetical protein GCM10010112_65430 [Actinoplanes lobatus]GIE44292.1 hypothetical protein Alo02nite_71900 [Actinoplanes lobatus]
MSALRILIDRYCAQTDAIDPGQRIEQFADRAEYEPQDAWLAWLEAKRAERATRPELASAWVRLAGRCLREHPDPICDLELVTLDAQVHNWLDEPREAIGFADEAWRRWLEFAGAPLTEDVVPSMRLLLDVLSRPHEPPELSDADLYVSWMSDRLAPEFEQSARLAMSLYGDLHAVAEAQAVADAHAAWAERWLPHEEQLAAVLGAMALTLGDVYARCGDASRALTVFGDALDRIGKSPLPGGELTAAQLRFNRANQLARLRRWAEAEAGYAAASGELSRLGEREAVLRVRYAVAHLRHLRGTLDPRLDELAEPAADYEDELRAADSAPDEINARQGLDRVYRLWCRVLADRFEARNARDVQMFLLLIFALKEEEGKIAGLWRRLADHPDATVLSEISVLVDRIRARPGSVLLILEQAADALLIVTFAGGDGPWHERVQVATVDRAGVTPFEDLIRAAEGMASALSDRVLPVVAAADDAFVDVCRRAWTALPERVRADLAAADTVLLNVDFQTDLDLFPVELLHDGVTYLGLRACVVQAPSLRDMNALLGENEVNAAATGSAVIVRADDELPHADEEVVVVEGAVEALGARPRRLASPDRRELLDTLDGGADLLHYVGHGLADKVGEELPLGPGRSVSARDIAALRGAPAPVTVLSACLTGRGRQLRTGEQQGFATTLLRAGAPAVLAAKYLLPDHITQAFWSYLYYFAGESPVERAALQTRQALAAKGHHPAAWSCFVLFGRPGVSIRAPHRQAARTWTSHVFRYLATGTAAAFDQARAALGRDDRLTVAQRDHLDADLVALRDGDGDRFDGDTVDGLDQYAEAMIAAAVVHAFGVLRTGDGRPEQDVHAAMGTLVATEPLLCDTYLLLAGIREIDRRLTTYICQEGRGRLLGAARRLRWLSADEDLEMVRDAIGEMAERVRGSLFFDVGSVAGVDAQTYRDADAGDRQAQKRMLHSLLVRRADPRALLSGDWTRWLLRTIGAGTHQAMADAAGAIDQAGRDLRITPERQRALVTLIEQFSGPGEVDPGTAAAVTAAFDGTAEARVIDLFLRFDTVTSGETEVSPDELREAAGIADELGAAGAAAYFRAVWAQRAATGDGLPFAALGEARTALAAYTSLVATDAAYRKKRAMTALLVAQLAAATGDGDLAAEAVRIGVADVDAGSVSSAVNVLVMQGDVAGARALAEKVGGRQPVGPAPVFPDDPEAISEQGSQRMHDGDLAGAVEWLSEARRRFEASGHPERCCGLLGDLAVVLRRLGNRAAAVRTYQEAIALCGRVGDHANLSRWSQNLALLYVESGARDDARTLLEQGRQAAERSGNSYQVSAALGNLGQFHAEGQEYAEAAGYLDEAIALAGAPQLAAILRRNRAEVTRRWVGALADEGDVTSAERVLASADERVAPTDDDETRQVLAWAWLRLAAAQSEHHRADQAAESAGRAAALFAEAGDQESADLARQAGDEVRSRVRLVAGDAGDPEAVRQRVTAAVTEGDVEAELDARTELALTLLPSGSPEAREALDVALALAGRAGSRRHELNLTVNAAPYLLTGGDAHSALAVARRASQLAGSEPNVFGVVAVLHLAQVFDEGFGEQWKALELYRRACRALATLSATDAGQVVRAEEASLLRGAQLAMLLGDAGEALRMWAVWDPEAAAAATDPGGGQERSWERGDPDESRGVR